MGVKMYDSKVLNYIPTLCSRAEFLFLVTFSKFSPAVHGK